jgi:hypothetical protein
VAGVGIVICTAPGCGGDSTNFETDGSIHGDSSSNDSNSVQFPDVGGDAAPACQGLACQVQSCGGNTALTTVSGVVYDPAGRNPLYNVYVYIPNATVEPITTGAVCTACQAPASGSPMPGAVQTNALGQFTVTMAPSGNNIPLVMQTGKFRRQIIIPTINPCVDNAIGAKDSNNLETITRLPRTQNEGNNGIDNLPQIAMATGGCDSLECLVRMIGIADSEFTATGRVHLFQGMSGATGAGDGKYTNAYQFWADQKDLTTHDIVVNSCECSPYARDTDGPAYADMEGYLNNGGRLFGTHYHYNWFASPTGPTDFQQTAQWLTDNPIAEAPFYINTTIPKGVALNAWIQNIWKAAPPPNGQIDLVYSNEDASQVNDTAPYSTTPWIYYGNSSLTSKAYGTSYLSFNTPITAMTQCGRAVFSDLHVAPPSGSGTFPAECPTGNPLTSPMNEQETALEFLFFDLSSCVSNDNQQPPPPPPN